MKSRIAIVLAASFVGLAGCASQAEMVGAGTGAAVGAAVGAGPMANLGGAMGGYGGAGRWGCGRGADGHPRRRHGRLRLRPRLRPEAPLRGLAKAHGVVPAQAGTPFRTYQDRLTGSPPARGRPARASYANSGRPRRAAVAALAGRGVGTLGEKIF